MEKLFENVDQPERLKDLQAIRDHFYFLCNLSPVKETGESLTYIFSQEPSEIKWLEDVFKNNNITVITDERELEEGGTVFDVTFIQQPEQK